MFGAITVIVGAVFVTFALNHSILLSPTINWEEPDTSVPLFALCIRTWILSVPATKRYGILASVLGSVMLIFNLVSDGLVLSAVTVNLSANRPSRVQFPSTFLTPISSLEPEPFNWIYAEVTSCGSDTTISRPAATVFSNTALPINTGLLTSSDSTPLITCFTFTWVFERTELSDRAVCVNVSLAANV